MPPKPALRIDLGELDPYFEQRANAKGQPVNVAMGQALASLLSGQVSIPKPPQKRTRRTVTFASVEEQAQARARAQALDQPLGTALRAVAIDQLKHHICISNFSNPHDLKLKLNRAGDSVGVRADDQVGAADVCPN